MCGIVGYIGNEKAAPVLLDGLSKLEYRGYDSAGIAVRKPDGDIILERAKGKLKELSDKINGGADIQGTCGIGHTRWATHGESNETNAHPHFSSHGNVVVVHNGIIENYRELKEKVAKRGYTFRSETDTEVISNLIEYYLEKYRLGPIDALGRFMSRAQGSYAIAVMFRDIPDVIYAARKDSPMIIGVEGNCSYIASDVPAILKYTRNVYYIGNLEMAEIRRGGVTFYDVDKAPIEKQTVKIEWNAEAAEKDGWEHFMIKEIHEQPAAIKNTINSAVFSGKIDFKEHALTEDEIKSVTGIQIVGCGSAYNVGVALQYVFEKLTRIPVRVELASEFRYRNPILKKTDLIIVISQSGETADSLAALREAKESGVRTVSIVNVYGSSIARESDRVIYTYAGPEIAVATTKAYSTQLVAGYLLAVNFASVLGTVGESECKRLIAEIASIPEKIEQILKNKQQIQRFAAEHVNAKDVFFIGRGIDYAVCLEGSLKLKEISYVHSEAYAAGELKHGTISLIERGTLVMTMLTQTALGSKTVSNMEEVVTRGAHAVTVGYAGEAAPQKSGTHFAVPRIDDVFAASLAVIPLQLVAYYMGTCKGFDVDKPRNLAKSVTVE